MDRKLYKVKLFGGIEFKDYWDLSRHPLYITLDKKQKPYFRIKEMPTAGYTKATSLTDIASYLRENEWSFESKYWKVISNEIQAAINIPHTDI